MTSGSEVLHHYAPVAAGALDEVEAAGWNEAADAGMSDLAVLVSRVCAELHGLRPLAPPLGYGRSRWGVMYAAGWRTIDGLTEPERVGLGFAEQFSVDVSSISDEQRRALFAHLGKAAANFAAVVFVTDVVPRTRAALDALFGADPIVDPANPVNAVDPVEPTGPITRATGTGIWSTLDTFSRAVPRLEALDPITTELVRLRGARQHQCRICNSLRSRPALVAGADEQMFSAVDEYECSDLAPEQKAALAFTDAMIWTPGHLDDDVVSALAMATTAEQRVELVLDITRNTLNKVAVALGADTPHIETGTEIYDIDTDGELVYGLSLD